MTNRTLAVRLAICSVVLAAIGCEPNSGNAPKPAETTSTFTPGGRVHLMRRQDPGELQPLRSSAPFANLVYYGGHVISNVKVVQVIYGAGTFIPEVTDGGVVSGGTTVNMASFFRDVTTSPLMDWLGEYDTDVMKANGGAGTGQHIGHGTFAGQVVITPSAANNGATLTDANIQAELKAQLDSAVLPAPDANTLYMIYFPREKKLTQGGTNSCVAGGFCAYHGTFAYKLGASEVRSYYGVMPDMGPGTGCDTGCGTGSVFQNETSVSSHELIEAVTDAEVGFAGSVGPPLAWYDTAKGEIGDICNAQHDVVTVQGISYTVQKEWSNRYAACISAAPTAQPDDFFLSASPLALVVSSCVPAHASLPMSVTTGNAMAVTVSVQKLPAGITAAFDHATLNSNGTAQLTLTAGPSAATQPATPFQIVATGASKVHLVEATLAVTVPTATLANLPTDPIAEATSSAGAAVSFTPPTGAFCQTPAPVTCVPAAGSVFPFGTTPVTCTANDGAGHSAQGSFHITVQDTTAPQLALPQVLKVEATSAAGAVGTYAPTARDLVDGSVPVTCTPASGTAFPMGSTPVTCTASDVRHNAARGSFSVLVADTTPPHLMCPPNVDVVQTSNRGAVVTYGAATAVDTVSASTLAYSLPSGAGFAVGTTPVQVTATDAAGNHATCSFNVVVRSNNTPVKAVGCEAGGPPGAAAALVLAGLLILGARGRRQPAPVTVRRPVSTSRRKPV